MLLVSRSFDHVVARRNSYVAAVNATMRRTFYSTVAHHEVTGKAPHMCGICGTVWCDKHSLTQDSVTAMMNRLIHRGPAMMPANTAMTVQLWVSDGSLSSICQAVISHSAMRIALSGQSSMARSTTSQLFRRRLEAKGHNLRSSGDSEVLVHLYEDEGTGMSRYYVGCSRWRFGMHLVGHWYWHVTGWAEALNLSP